MSTLGAKSTEHRPVQEAPKKKASPKVVAIKDSLKHRPVYFAAVGIGNFVLESPNKEVVRMKDGGYDRVFTPGLEVQFRGDIGVSSPLDPRIREQAELIEAAREHIRRHNDPADPMRDSRVDDFKFREIDPGAAQPPVANWDGTDPAKLPAVVEALGLDVETCLRYELERPASEQSGPRKTLVRELERMLEDVAEDPLSSVEVA